MQVKVYLNEARGSMAFGFDPEGAQLRLATEFEIGPDAPQANLAAKQELAGEKPVSFGILGYVFEQLNIGGDLVPATDWTEAYRADGNRSLSVGDVITVGETAWTVDHLGFSTITTDELKGAL